jgi:hypothetical protein
MWRLTLGRPELPFLHIPERRFAACLVFEVTVTGMLAATQFASGTSDEWTFSVGPGEVPD